MKTLKQVRSALISAAMDMLRCNESEAERQLRDLQRLLNLAFGPQK